MGALYHRPTITLNLGAGAARGLTHMGVLRAFEEQKIPYDMIIGVSMGAVIGGLYAYQPDWKQTRDVMVSILNSETFRESFMGIWPQEDTARTARRFLHSMQKIYLRTGVLGRILLSDGIISEEDIEEVFLSRYPEIFIQQTKIPFACTAVDILTGKSFLFIKGKLVEAVLASASIPMVFPPRKVNGRRYVDGGVLDKLGVDASAHLKPKYVIAVDASNPADVKTEIPRGALDVIIRSLDISVEERLVVQRKKANFVLHSVTEDIHIGAFGLHKELLDMGYESTIAQVEAIREALHLTNPWKKYFSFFNWQKLKNLKPFSN